jgi:uncharacterized protein YcfJ
MAHTHLPETLMKRTTRLALAAAGLLASLHTMAQVTLYQREDYRGRSFIAAGEVPNLMALGFNDRASSVVVKGTRRDRWELCEDSRFRGRCVMLPPGRYASLAAIGLNDRISSVRLANRGDVEEGPPTAVPPDTGRIVFYEREGFQGRSMSADGPMENFRRSGFDEQASSIIVRRGRWEACQDRRYAGDCVVLRPGQYPSLSAMGMNDRISSVRPVERDAAADDRRPAPLPLVAGDYSRRDAERLFQAPVTAVRAVVEDSGERCWVEPQQVVTERSGGNANVPGALLGAVIGGILGHQVGGGTGKDVATGIGVVAGAAIGGNSGRGDAGQQVVTTENVQRCSRNPGRARAAYWDVTYSFRGQEYRVQTTRAPGRTVTVNEQGEPRA